MTVGKPRPKNPRTLKKRGQSDPEGLFKVKTGKTGAEEFVLMNKDAVAVACSICIPVQKKTNTKYNCTLV